jgi:hypothetical protein
MTLADAAVHPASARFFPELPQTGIVRLQPRRKIPQFKLGEAHVEEKPSHRRGKRQLNAAIPEQITDCDRTNQNRIKSPDILLPSYLPFPTTTQAFQWLAKWTFP